MRKPSRAPNESEADKPIATDLNAPFISFDSIPAFGVTNGMFNIVLAASRPTLMLGGQVPNIPMVRAQLQCSLEGLHMLRASIEQLILLGTNTPGQAS
jgi:hypothetical protein